MRDNIEKEGIRRAIDRFQKEHPCHLTFDVTLFDNGTDFTAVQRSIDIVAKKCQEDADIHIICEMAKLYLEGVRPMVKPKQEWIPCSERLPEESGQYYVSGGDKVWICDFLIIPTFKGGWCNNVSNPVVEAWMPLPEPYKKEGDEK